MKKRFSFLLLIATLHLLFTLSASGPALLAESSNLAVQPLGKMLLCPLLFPLRGIMPSVLVAPSLGVNSLLWGLMAERLVFGRKKVMRLRRIGKAQ